MTADHFFGKPKLASHVSDFVLEQFAQGFDQLELHVRLERVEKAARGIDGHELNTMMGSERALDLLALVETKQSGVDKDAGELIADRAVDERRGDRGVDAAREAADDARRTHHVANLRHLG